MNKLIVILAFHFMIFIMTDALAQRRGNTPHLPWATGMLVDGRLMDWSGDLSGEYEDQQLYYELANDAEYLYLAVRIEDYDRQVQAVTRGLSLTINTEGRKRDGQTIIFPVADRIGFRSRMSGDDEIRSGDLRLAALESVRSIQVRQMDLIPDGPIALTNQFGIEAAASIGEDDVLYVEMRLPLHLLERQRSLTGRTLAYNLKINGVRSPAAVAQPRVSPYARTNYPAQYGNGRVREERGVWGRMVLAERPTNK